MSVESNRSSPDFEGIKSEIKNIEQNIETLGKFKNDEIISDFAYEKFVKAGDELGTLKEKIIESENSLKELELEIEALNSKSSLFSNLADIVGLSSEAKELSQKVNQAKDARKLLANDNKKLFELAQKFRSTRKDTVQNFNKYHRELDTIFSEENKWKLDDRVSSKEFLQAAIYYFKEQIPKADERKLVDLIIKLRRLIDRAQNAAKADSSLPPEHKNKSKNLKPF